MSDLKKIFKKVNGFSVIKNYIRARVIGTAIGELFLLGTSKKALEILRLSTQLKIKNKLKKYFKNITKPKCSPKKGGPYWAKLFERFLKFILQQHCKFYFLHIFLLLLFFRLICLLLLHVQQFL